MSSSLPNGWFIYIALCRICSLTKVTSWKHTRMSEQNELFFKKYKSLRGRIQFEIYIYIYTYILSSTDYFVVSQLFSVARHVGRLKLGSKPAQLYLRLSIISLRQRANHVSTGIIRQCIYIYIYIYI